MEACFCAALDTPVVVQSVTSSKTARIPSGTVKWHKRFVAVCWMDRLIIATTVNVRTLPEEVCRREVSSMSMIYVREPARSA